MIKMNKEQIIKDYFQENNNITQEQLLEFITTNARIKWSIFREEELKYYKEDLENIVENYNAENDTDYTFTDDEYKIMVNRYEDNLAEYSGWYDIGYSLVSDWCDDKAKENE